jgi:protein involved in sex pheromone biosynthesis
MKKHFFILIISVVFLVAGCNSKATEREAKAAAAQKQLLKGSFQKSKPESW